MAKIKRWGTLWGCCWSLGKFLSWELSGNLNIVLCRVIGWTWSRPLYHDSFTLYDWFNRTEYVCNNNVLIMYGKCVTNASWLRPIMIGRHLVSNVMDFDSYWWFSFLCRIGGWLTSLASDWVVCGSFHINYRTVMCFVFVHWSVIDSSGPGACWTLWDLMLKGQSPMAWSCYLMYDSDFKAIGSLSIVLYRLFCYSSVGSSPFVCQQLTNMIYPPYTERSNDLSRVMWIKPEIVPCLT